MARSYFIQTYGCQMNHSDSERVDSVLANLGLEKAPEMDDADLILFNTCSIRQKAEDRVYGFMKHMAQLRKQRPHLLVGITGCMVRKTATKTQEERDKLFDIINELDLTLRIEELPKLPNLLKTMWPSMMLPMTKDEELESYFNVQPNYKNPVQAYVPISMGCDNFCTFCIVPYSRRREMSRPMNDIYEECKKLVEQGCLEITLLGQNVNSYGISNNDKKNPEFDGMEQPFVRLLEKIDSLHEKGLHRLRFTSNHPKDLSDELIDAHVTLTTLQPYIHLPIQAGNDRVLKKMNRTYTVDWYRNLIKKIRDKIPDCAISTDIIVGFCSETEEEFMDTYNLFKEIEWDKAFHARFSSRKGTFAGMYLEDDVTYEEKKDRWHRLNDLLREISHKKHKAVEGEDVELLVEQHKDGISMGRDPHFRMIEFDSDEDLTGKMVHVKITKGLEWLCKGAKV